MEMVIKSAPPRGRPAHIDEGVAHTADRGGTDGGQHAVARVYRQKRRDIVRHDRKDEDAAHRPPKEGPAKALVAQKRDGDVDDDGHDADGQAEQGVQDGRNAGNAGDREVGAHSKVI